MPRPLTSADGSRPAADSRFYVPFGGRELDQFLIMPTDTSREATTMKLAPLSGTLAICSSVIAVGRKS
ncbi:MAG: hypothetical protein IT427_17375 [Pirellulales bacterium]|nr:hypothetical protein [Pirellulales bacterium]